MKPTLIFFLLFAGIQACFAQSPAITTQDTSVITPQRWRDTCFGLLDLSSSQIPSGYLLDYSLIPFTDSNYNSLLTTAVDTIEQSGKLLSLLSTLQSSAVNGSAGTLIPADSMFINAYRSHRNTGNFPLLFLYQRYQRINSNALSLNQFSLSADSFRIIDVPGRSSSPYINDYCFAFTPFQNNIIQFGTLTFSTPSSLWQMPGITSVSVDFGDGTGAHILTPNSTISVNYSSSGTKVLTAQVTTGAGTFIARSSIQFQLPVSYHKVDTAINVTVSPIYASKSDYISAHTGARASNGNRKAGTAGMLDITDACTDGTLIDKGNCDINPGAHIEIENGCDHVFDKPIIIVEGFDPLGDVSTEDLRYAINTTGLGQTFLATMREQGYDFVYVILTKNTDFIENNAAVLEEVISRVNALKTGTNKNTIIGLSMGGLIARWALRDMENKAIDHQTLNYFSYDSPHQGANVPFGLQALYNELKKDFPQLAYQSDFTKVGTGFTSHAAEEMLVLNANSTNGTPVSDLRALFAQDMINLGYPQLTNNYGISLGRGNNTTSTTDAGNGNQFGSFVPGSDIFHGALTFLVQNMSADAYAGPNNSSGQVLHYVYSGLRPIKIFGITIGSVYAGRTKNVFLSSVPSYDDVPGGYDNVQARFVDAWTKKVRGFAGPATFNGHYGHNFVPVASALDLQNQNFGSGHYLSDNMFYTIDNAVQNSAQVTGNTLSPSTLSPFKAVLTYTSDCGSVGCQFDNSSDKLRSLGGLTSPMFGNVNQYHEGALSNQAQLFVQRKILGTNTFTNCSGATDFCGSSSISIAGPLSVCDANESYTLSASGAFDNITIQWNFPHGLLQIVTGAGTPFITVKRTGSSSGTETITAVLTNSCGQTSNYTLNVAVGGPPTPTIAINGIAPYANGPMDVQITTTAATPYKWYVDNILVATSFSATATINGGSCGYHNVRADVANTCQTTSSTTILYQRSCSGGHSFAVSPNPATDIVTVQSETPGSGNAMDLTTGQTVNTVSQGARITSSSGTTAMNTVPIISPSIESVKLVSISGNVSRQWKFGSGNKQVKLNVAGLVAGTYILEISDGKQTERQKIIIASK